MIELHSDELIFTFPAIQARIAERIRLWIEERIQRSSCEERTRLSSSQDTLIQAFDRCIPKVRATISFQRTLRIPDDGRNYPLPPGLGNFPISHVDDFAAVPDSWRKRGGVMLPVHRTEALWLKFSTDYPMAVKIGAGGVCSISGQAWSAALNPDPQNYVVLPEQPWLDGFRATGGIVRQFVAVPLGKQLTVERQLTGEEKWGGLQFQTFPMASKQFPFESIESTLEEQWQSLIGSPKFCTSVSDLSSEIQFCRAGEVGFGAGGRMKQNISRDPYGLNAWDASQTSRCYAHLCLSDDWQRITGTPPPNEPPTAADYTKAGLPWFMYDNCGTHLTSKTALSEVKSISALVGEKTGLDLTSNVSVTPGNVVELKPNLIRRVREF